jgi:hypothetical protein
MTSSIRTMCYHYLLLFCVILNASACLAQFPVEVFYSSNWNLAPKVEGSYVRTGLWSYKDDFFTGEFIDRSTKDTNRVITRGCYKNGMRNGFFTEYHNDGHLKSKGYYVNNQKTGNWDYYDRFGVLTHSVLHDSMDFIFTYIHPQLIRKLWFHRQQVVFYKFETENLSSLFLKGNLKNSQKTGKWVLKVDGEVFLNERYRNGKFLYSVLMERGMQLRDDQQYLPTILNTDVYLDQTEKRNQRFSTFFSNQYPFRDVSPGMETEYEYKGIIGDSVVTNIIPPVYPDGYRKFRTFMNERIRCFVPPDNPVPQQLMITIYIDTNGKPYQFEFKDPIDEECRQKVIAKVRAMKNWYPAATSSGELISSRIMFYLECDIVRTGSARFQVN